MVKRRGRDEREAGGVSRRSRAAAHRGGPRQVVVVESPAKARTIGGWLGPSSRAIATRGHLRDLPAKAGSVDPGDGFAMAFEAGKGAQRTLGAIARALGRADELVLATDPDREGEAIAWQVLDWLEARDAIGGRPVLRAAFHEVTRAAVREALIRPRAIDMDLVRAWQARRALDYLVGYGLSPVLWRKLPGCRSAGRVQSVALRLLCEREAEIEGFAARKHWSVEAELAAPDGARFGAALAGLDGTRIGESGLASETAARDAAARVRAGSFTVASVERNELRRQALPPFTTAALQQEASRRLGFSVAETMRIAQRLYEGVDLGGETAGLVTYIRTDSTAMAEGAAAEAHALLRAAHGAAWVPPKPRLHRARDRRVREAHEAVRPTDFSRAPEDLEGRLDRAAVDLYALIRNRALASQMRAARFERVRVGIASAAGGLALEASGLRLVFDGHLRVWGADGEAEPGGDAALPALEPGERVPVSAAWARGRVGDPPQRYTEAGLVRRLDELGIGRPSTWEAILAVLVEREYAVLHRRRFVPTERGRVVTAFLEHGFARWMDYGFTAAMEDDLDRIAAGALARDTMLARFWAPFDAALGEAGGRTRAMARAAVEDRLDGFLFGPGGAAPGRRRCPACGRESLELKLSRYGPFVGCAAWPGCDYRRGLSAAAAASDGYAGPHELGRDPGAGTAVTLRRGPTGWYVQRGEWEGKRKPERMSLPPGLEPEEVDLGTALGLLALPRRVGLHPETGAPVLAGIGRYGPWVRHEETWAAIPDGEDVLAVGINRAVALIADKVVRQSRMRGPNVVLRDLGRHPGDGAPVRLRTGHYGPFVAHRRRYASLPEDADPDALGLDEAVALLEAAEKARG